MSDARPLLLDASALTAFLRRERGWEAVGKAFATQRCLISATNVVETEGKLVSEGTYTPAQVRRQLALIAHLLNVVPFEVEHQRTAAFYYARRKPYSLSLGDALCLGSADSLGADILTAESAWAKLPDLPFEVQLIR